MEPFRSRGLGAATHGNGPVVRCKPLHAHDSHGRSHCRALHARSYSASLTRCSAFGRAATAHICVLLDPARPRVRQRADELWAGRCISPLPATFAAFSVSASTVGLQHYVSGVHGLHAFVRFRSLDSARSRLGWHRFRCPHPMPHVTQRASARVCNVTAVRQSCS